MKRAIGIAVAAVMVAAFFLTTPVTFEASAAGPFTFGAAGDFGENTNSVNTFAAAASSNLSLFLAVGDFSYSGSGSEQSFCNMVTSAMGTNFPVEIVSGNHEDNGPDGLIQNYAACLPDHLNSTGYYSREYYFDYPAGSPLARFIMISPDLTFTDGSNYEYTVGTVHYTWLANTIDAAHAAGIPWVIVGMHKICFSSGSTFCDVRQDLVDLLEAKRVDLVLMGHDHSYQRSKQLSCAIRQVFIPECVANDGSAGVYTKGAGPIWIIDGTGGAPLSSISATDNESPYFASMMGPTTPGTGFGFVRYTVSQTSISAQTVFSGSFQDSFAIGPASGTTSGSSGGVAPIGTPFRFTASGDWGKTTNTVNTLNRIASSGSNFTLALGDFSYSTATGNEATWCSLVTSKVGSSYPFQLISGTNEDNGPYGLIDNFTTCLPNQVGPITGIYGKEYYFDYPAASPLARFILVSPGESFTNGGGYSYTIGTYGPSSHFTWLMNAIDGARASGIHWVIVGMHLDCVTSGTKYCDVKQDVVDLLQAKRVDLVLQAHDDNYQRSKQLTCGVRTVFIPECVANAGASGTYTKGAGTVFVIDGTSGAATAKINSSDPDFGYFATTMGTNTPGYGYGFVSYTVYQNEIVVVTNFSGTYADSFIVQG